MRGSVFRRGCGALMACAAVLLPGLASAAGWTATAGDLGRDGTRFAVHLRAHYGVMDGSEIAGADPSRGVDVGLSARVLGNVSLVGSFAVDRADVSGQLIQLIDQNVRADGRSGTVVGEVETSRVRVGLRVDAYRELSWKFQPYLMGSVTRSTVDVTLDSVDGRKPPILLPGNEPLDAPKDISSFSTDQLGLLGRIGVEYRLTTMIGVDVSGDVEVVELEPGTNTIFSFGTGLALRF